MRDLDGDGEPEILVDAYTGGAHCCLFTHEWWWDGAGYEEAVQEWGSSLYRLGGGLLVGSDDHFDYAFSAYAFSRPPVLVLDARLRDVTAQHPCIVLRDLRHQRHIYTLYRRRYSVRPALAACVADLHSLGRHATADTVLREGGYMSRNSASAASTTCGSCGNAICSSGLE